MGATDRLTIQMQQLHSNYAKNRLRADRRAKLLIYKYFTSKSFKSKDLAGISG
jgi:hypothetical protein